jgi:hypothetical protein
LAGIAATRELDRSVRGNPSVQVTLVDRHNFFSIGAVTSRFGSDGQLVGMKLAVFPASWPWRTIHPGKLPRLEKRVRALVIPGTYANRTAGI